MNTPLRRLAFAALPLAALAALAVPALAGPRQEATARQVAGDVAQLAKLTGRRIRPPAVRVSRTLPDAAKREESLKEPAATAATQVATTLSELRQMSALTLDPHYTPALVAAGRAYLAVTGQDPITHTTVNAEYKGLEAELTAGAAQLGQAAKESGALSANVKRLSRRLRLTRRHVIRLQAQIRRLHTARSGRH